MIKTVALFSFTFLLLTGVRDTHDLNQTTPYDFKHYICYATNQQIVIDGKLDEAIWGKTPFSDSFIDIEGDVKPKPLHDTKFKMLWDDDYLYIGAWIEEPHIWATYTERESVIFHENDFEIFIDPNGDTHNYYEIEVNALNTIWDLLLTKPYRDGGRAISSWDVKGMQTAVHLEGTINDPSDIDTSWTVEFALPWDALKEYAFESRKPKDGEQWRINFSRVQWRLDIEDGSYKKRINPETKKPYPEFNWVWSPQGEINMHRPETWGYVQFSGIPAGSAEAAFIFDNNEWCKWDLRTIYYAQKEFRKSHNTYAEDLDELNFSSIYFKKSMFTMDASGSGYQAKLKQPHEQKTWIIRGDGRVWSETYEDAK